MEPDRRALVGQSDPDLEEIEDRRLLLRRHIPESSGGEIGIEHRLGEITVPTILTSGRHDKATPELVQVVHDGIPGSEWVVFEDSAHMTHAEETKSYLEIVDDFLTRAEAFP